MAPARGPVGRITRGTTHTNRLRRVDRWIATRTELRRLADPLVVDLGYGASGVTALELHARLARTRPDVEVLGLEIDPERVERARGQLAEVQAAGTAFAPDARVDFARGGFEVPLPHGRAAGIIRAMNVLRQYDETDVAAAWSQMAGRLAPDGLLVEGTCDERGRVCAWIAVGPDALPRTLTLSLRLEELHSPLVAAERLPKALIHRNVPGEGVHRFLAALDAEWERAAGLGAFGPRQRWVAAVDAVAAQDWPVRERRRARLGEITVAWDAVAPD